MPRCVCYWQTLCSHIHVSDKVVNAQEPSSAARPLVAFAASQDGVAEPAQSGADKQAEAEERASEQQAARANRKRPAEGLRDELTGLGVVAGWDPNKQRNLMAFFNRPGPTGRNPGESAAKRLRMDRPGQAAAAVAGGPSLFSTGHKDAQATANGSIMASLRAPTSRAWWVALLVS